MNSWRNAVLVGLLFALAVAILAYLVSSVAGRKGLGRNESYLVHMTFNDATGLAKRSRVVVAGIDIGKVEKIELVGRRARVTIRVNNEYPLYEDASVLKQMSSLLAADADLDIDPGTDTLPRIPDGGEIKNVKVAPGMDQILASVQRVAGDAEKISGSLAGSVGTDQGREDINHILKELTETSTIVNRATAQSAEQLARILGNLEVLTARISRLEPSQEQQVVAILANVREITDQTKQAIGAVNKVIDAQQGNVDAAMKQVREALARLDATLDSAQHVVKNVEQGNGVVGKLLTDKELADRVTHAVTGATDYIDRLTGLKVELGVRSSLGLQPLGHGQFAFPVVSQVGVKIRPANSSRYYGLDLVSDTIGSMTHSVQTQLINDAPLTTSTNTFNQALTVNAYLAQMWGPATFRIGLMENTGGVGVDFDIIPNTLSVHADAFNFLPVIPGVDPRVRVYGQYTFAKYFDLYVGGDDLANSPVPNPDPTKVNTSYGRYVYGGAGFHFTDDDVKAILGTTGVPKP